MSDRGERCQVCGADYETVYHVPDAQWEAISPKPVEGAGGGGLLCIGCADRRLRLEGLHPYWTVSFGGWPSEVERSWRALLALRLIEGNEHGESWSAGVAMSALASINEIAPLPAPSVLSGADGEVVFVRGDLADTETKAREAALTEGYNVGGMACDYDVEMLPVPDHFIDLDDYEWAAVQPGTPGAVRYWRFTL